jgi:SAM-dependent methyltransferase
MLASDPRACVCGKSEARSFVAVERQLGLGDEFEYLECASCGSLRIATIPANLSRYYPSDYYSFRSTLPWRERLQPLALAVGLWFPFIRLSRVHFHLPTAAQAIGFSRRDRVLDVGSGIHGMSAQLRAIGFRNAMGLDPFVAEDIKDKHGLAVKKAFLSEITEHWDKITFNHSLEHVPDPLADLRTANSLLAPGGQIVVRIPVAAWAYAEYGPNWAQLDAPRHLFVPSERGFRALAERAGMRVTRVLYDSADMQFWGSEAYRRNESLMKAQANFWQHHSRRDRNRMLRRADELNRKGEGDQAAFFLAPL